MKKGIHPEYREVIFKDVAVDYTFKTRSTIAAKETITWEDGNEYPFVKIDISSKSHPFYTGNERILDTEGRIDKFKKKYKTFYKK